MHRCVMTGLKMVAALALTLSAQAQAQAFQRPFPATALRGELIVGNPPQVSLNGQAAQLAPGSRIKGENNLIQLPATLVGFKLRVNYTLDNYGLIKDVWILTPAERAVHPWPHTLQEAQTWVFNPSSQTWTKP